MYNNLRSIFQTTSFISASGCLWRHSKVRTFPLHLPAYLCISVQPVYNSVLTEMASCLSSALTDKHTAHTAVFSSFTYGYSHTEPLSEELIQTDTPFRKRHSKNKTETDKIWLLWFSCSVKTSKILLIKHTLSPTLHTKSMFTLQNFQVTLSS